MFCLETSPGIAHGVRSIAIVEPYREQAGQATATRRYFISSPESAPKLLLQAVRAHWGIENKRHWVLDIAFREDECRIRQGNAAENLATAHRAESAEIGKRNRA